jgi:outer membrane protein OmpA-like peptidoglycan-associated protein
VLTGTAASQAQGEAAVAALLNGSRGGASWTSAITGYTPPPPVAAEEPSSSEPPSSEPVSAEASSSEPPSASSSEPMSSEASSVEPPSEQPASSQPSAEPSGAASSEPSAGPVAEDEPTEDRSLIVVDPLPARFTFEASKESGQPIALKGVVLRDATIAYFAELAGNVPTDDLIVSDGLPTDFVASGAAGLRALIAANEGRLGYDGTRWWLRGMVETPAARDAITGAIAALPSGKDWSVFIGILTPLEICRDRVAGLERLNAITFQSGSATLTDTSQPILDELAIDLNICPEASVHVEGHTDADGAEDLNLALSVARAEAVVEALISRDVNLERLYAEGYGESQPIADNETRDGKARNRRIAFSISEE